MTTQFWQREAFTIELNRDIWNLGEGKSKM
jgi:hypothetical protein